ncbi:MAG: 3-deoxy-D-manno-octulosonic acid transferase [Synergistaceae bacterium]|nr:3-deoxy-D-manno-octulosonic acid transferase [Synergistaceae bacterium]
MAAWSYRLGMRFYKAGISAFFAAGGLSRLKKKYKAGIEERMGVFDPGVPQNVFWVHAVSVGEVQSSLPLLEAAGGRPDLPRVLSTVTATGRTLAEQLAPRSVTLIYNPWDTPRFVKRALDTLKPRAYVAMETERWPVVLAELHSRGIPAFLVNGRLSEGSLNRMRWQKTFWRGVLCCFDRMMVRFESDKENFLSLGVPEEKIVVTGDCKVDAMFDRKAGMERSAMPCLRRGDGALFIAGSTHAGEDEIVLSAFDKICLTHPDARLILAPRHPERAPAVAAASRPHGETALLTELEAGGIGDWDVMVVNRIGALFDLYARVSEGGAGGAFVGGSLVPKGGQNPMEPALFGVQATHGPDMSDFPDMGRMDASGASLEVRNAEELAEAWLTATNPDARDEVKRACKNYFASIGGAGTRSWEIIKDRAGL